MKNAVYIIALGTAALAQSSSASAEAPVFEWEKPGYEAATLPGKSRAEVIAELNEARSNGTLSMSDRDYPAFEEVARIEDGKTRAQVRAEAIEARRLGLSSQGDAQMPMATPEQLAAIQLAGLRAVQTQVSRGLR
jgi:Domain of unknown function (DUF4148)